MLKIVYMGTPDFSVLPLKYIFEQSGCELVGVVTNNDKPVGRKKILTPPPVKVFALENNLPVFQYDSIRKEGVEDIKNLAPDLIITCAFGQILSQEIIDIPKYGIFNIHASLLPKYRGASPIHHAILNGEKETGVTIMRTDIGIDTGDILLSKSLQIGDDESCGELFNRLSKLGAECVLEAIKLIENGNATYVKQDETKASLTKMIKKEQAKIDWNKSNIEIKNMIRAFNPAPVAYTYLNGEPFKVYKATLLDGEGEPGTILSSDKQLVLACGKGAISLTLVQKAGGKAMGIRDFLLGNKLKVGEKLQ